VSALIAQLASATVWGEVEEVMSKWKYDRAGQIAPIGPERLELNRIACTTLHPVRNAFTENASRIYAFWRLKPDIVDHACVTTGNIYVALFDLTGHVDLLKAFQDYPDILDRISARLREQFEKKLKNNPDASPNEIAGYDQVLAVERLESLMDNYPSGWDKGFAATLAAMVIASWTTFEVLAGDLWEAALNAHPRTLCNLSGDKKRISRAAGAMGREKQDASGTDEGDNGPSDTHLLKVLQQVTGGSFNAGSVMGTVLRTNFAFHKLSGIRQAYSAAFAKRHDKIDKILADTALDKLNIVRNLLVHDSGIVKEKFLRGARDISWQSGATEGKPLDIDGEIVRELVKPVLQACVELILAVDEWIAAKPPA
jgi:hypothetical protein